MMIFKMLLICFVYGSPPMQLVCKTSFSFLCLLQDSFDPTANVYENKLAPVMEKMITQSDSRPADLDFKWMDDYFAGHANDELYNFEW